jgi:predicted nucleic acid-binding Zn ribbon protein
MSRKKRRLRAQQIIMTIIGIFIILAMVLSLIRF